jgi:hypothetical protein
MRSQPLATIELCARTEVERLQNAAIRSNITHASYGDKDGSKFWTASDFPSKRPRLIVAAAACGLRIDRHRQRRDSSRLIAARLVTRTCRP